jgi:hypothetical protein
MSPCLPEWHAIGPVARQRILVYLADELNWGLQQRGRAERQQPADDAVEFVRETAAALLQAAD